MLSKKVDLSKHEWEELRLKIMSKKEKLLKIKKKNRRFSKRKYRVKLFKVQEDSR